MEKNNKISIIVTAHNYGIYLEQCLDSLLSQTHEPREIILINDSSNDSTDKIMKKYVIHDLIRYYKVDFQHAQKARRFGLNHASGYYVLFFDADNIAKPDLLQGLYDAIKRENADLVYCSHILIDEKGRDVGKWKAGRYSYSRLQRLNFIDVSSLCKKDFLKEEFFDYRINRFQDWDIWLSYLDDKSRVTYLPEKLIRKRVHKKSISNTQEKYFEKAKVMSKHGMISFLDPGDIQGRIYFRCLCKKCVKDKSIEDHLSSFRKKGLFLRKNNFFVFNFAQHVEKIEDLSKKKYTKDLISIDSWQDVSCFALSQKHFISFLNITTSVNSFLQKIFFK